MMIQDSGLLFPFKLSLTLMRYLTSLALVLFSTMLVAQTPDARKFVALSKNIVDGSFLPPGIRAAIVWEVNKDKRQFSTTLF
jgi:hypothetical protein